MDDAIEEPEGGDHTDEVCGDAGCAGEHNKGIEGADDFSGVGDEGTGGLGDGFGDEDADGDAGADEGDEDAGETDVDAEAKELDGVGFFGLAGVVFLEETFGDAGVAEG